MQKLFLAVLLILVGLPRPGCAQSGPLYFPPLAPAGTWSTVAPQQLGWCQPQLDSLLNFLGRKQTKSFIILKDGRIVVERYYGTFTQDSVWYWASAGKSLTAALVGIAQQDGLLTLADSTTRYLGPGWTSVPRPKEKLVTIRQQLTMTTGLDDAPPPPCTNEDTRAACLLYRADAGTRWAYHTGPYRLLMNVVASASSLTINAYTRQKLSNRIGMGGAWVDDVYYSRARDMARFGLLIQNRGTWDQTAVLRDTAYFRHMTTPSQPLNRAYGYLWWLNGQTSHMLPGSQLTFPGPLIPAAPADMIAALGKNDQKIYVVPSLGLVVVRQGEAAGPRQLALSSFDNQLWTYLMGVFCRPTATSPAGRGVAFSLYPNPAADAVTITLAHAEAGSTLRLTDLPGRVLRQQAAAGLQNQMPTADLPEGVYLLQWLAADGSILCTRRLQKTP
ncbi:serine hydrolase [Hymenobacter elongatus]|uniref:T9SS type A sorting domain-containing protein n=1 Tax=Hymenobacter elongatus TaxID=877208 RepID=A0A4Z0PGR2_9BACT|nr:serine hydrolase [Hymenobacter elongatus]TGE13976.1 T9SS type A sorting domain-containing protein [Hymenobacter elongatus]